MKKKIHYSCLLLLLICNCRLKSQNIDGYFADKKIQPLILLQEPVEDTVINISEYSHCADGKPVEGHLTKYLKDAVVIPFNNYRSKFKPTPTLNEFTLLFSIINKTSKSVDLFFRCGSPALLKISGLGINSPDHISAGFLGNNELSNRFTPTDFVHLKIQPGTNYYSANLQFMGSYLNKVIPELYTASAFQKMRFQDTERTRPQIIFHALILGGILVMSLFMFAQYFLNRDKAYLFYAIYAIVIFLFFEKVFELNCNIRIISLVFPKYVYLSHCILQLLTGFFYIAFLKKILNITTKEKFFWLYCNSMMVLLAATAFLYLAGILFFPESHSVISILVTACTVISAVAFFPILLILLFRPNKDKILWYVFAGFCFLTTGALLVIYLNRTGQNVNFRYLPPMTFMETGALLEIIFLGFALGYKTHITKAEKDRAEYQIKETEMAALKAQMNPHFIFNCINSIDAYIHSNDKYNATLYLNKFAKLLRNILDGSKENTIPFSKDIETLKLYVELEELRHENKFKTLIAIDDELMSSDYKVPPLIIQPFVENAILHGLKNRQDNNGVLHIEIKKSGDKIQYLISDNGIGRDAANKIMQNKESHYGMQMSYDRIKLFNQEQLPSLTVTDLYNNGYPAGTKIEVLLKLI